MKVCLGTLVLVFVMGSASREVLQATPVSETFRGLVDGVRASLEETGACLDVVPELQWSVANMTSFA
jgi:hypothetical protein